MIVFDVDGTLIGGEHDDWESFDGAFLEAAGFPFARDFLKGVTEVTARAIVHRALMEGGLPDLEARETAMRTGYLRRLHAVHAARPDTFRATEGAVALLADLRARAIPFAVATGDWRESILFKLRSAGVDITGVPLVTSSEFSRRSEIIAEAVRLGGGSLGEAVYVGDGPWDYRACQTLGIRFIGVGARRELLGREGATHLLPHLEPQGFWAAFHSLPRPSPALSAGPASGTPSAV
jgi:phosphoglycolate phosphatase-like HAD superfamily hydrolase